MENNYDTPVEMKVDQQCFADFREVGKWAGFLAIVGFIMLALMIVFSFSVLFMAGSIPISANGGTFPKGLVFVLYLFLAVLYFFPTWYLFRFADLLRKSFKSGNSSEFNLSIRYLKNFFVFIGIFTIIGLAIMLIAFFIGLAMGSIF
ncbi:MAG TPA: hypothetical protein VE870_15940 [Bacteroidales bacterium]|nr:hypothetical protein [Bacteroidales bacterium]